MSYTAKTWVTGEVIQAVDLNHAEQGIATAQSGVDAISANGAIGTANLAGGAVTAAKLGESATDIIADTFSTSNAYSVGDYVIYSGALYRFTADKTAGAWDSTKVVTVALADDVSGLKSAMGKFEHTPMLSSTDIVPNYYVRGDNGYTVASSSYVCTNFVPIPAESDGLILKSNCFFGSIVGAAFYDSTKTFISGIEDSGAWAQKTISVTIPNGARYFRATLQTSAYTDPSDFGISYQKTINGLDDEVGNISAKSETNAKNISAQNNSILSIDNSFGSVSDLVLGDTADGEHVIERTYRMTNETVYSSVVGGTLTTDWSNFVIYVWKYENGAWSAIGWQTINYTLLPNVGYRFVIGRVNYSTADLTQAEQEYIISNTKVITHLQKTLSSLVSVPRVMSRQGEGYGYPDNSLQAVKAALDDGFKMIRVSVAVTSDNVFYCTHVYELEHNSTLKHVKQNGVVYTEDIDINASTSTFINSLTYKGYPIPTLDSVMAEVVKHDINSVTWEFKGTFTDAQLQQLIETANFYNVPIVYSGGYLEIDQLTAVNTNLNIGVIFNYTDSLGTGFKTRYAGKYKTMRYDCYWGDTVSETQVKTVIHPDVKLKFGAGTIPNASDVLGNYIRWVDVIEVNYQMANFRS